MVKIGILGSTGRVGSLLIDDLQNDKDAKLSAVHVTSKLLKTLPQDTIVTNDIKVLFDSCDVIIDFSKPSGTEALLTEVIENGAKMVLVRTSMVLLVVKKKALPALNILVQLQKQQVPHGTWKS
jgi:4-hydroxy-tetrahydrodipicolinate reductase